MDKFQKLHQIISDFNSKVTLSKMITCVSVVAVCFFLSTGFWNHFSISRTDSAGSHFFWYTKDFSPSDISQNKYIMFSLITKFEPLCSPPRGCKVIKRVACDEGSKIQTIGKEFYCNGAFLGKAKNKSKKGHLLNSFAYNGVIPKGYAFMCNDHPDSYDSRYYGLVKKDYITAMVTPLF